MYFHKDIVLSLLVNLVLIRCYVAYDMKSWMSQVPDHVKLFELAIPGTHDSGAFRIPLNVGETQDWSVNQQLNNGIRFFDIRISNNHRSDDFEIRHGILRLGSFKELVMKYVKNFLIRYPSETILMSIKDEEDPLDVNRLEQDFIRNSEYKFHLSTVMSTTGLGAVRGKIVLFRRYPDSSLGIQWKGNSDLYVQDDYNLGCEKKIFGICYSLDYPKKARKVVAFLKRAVQSRVHRFFINFASAQYKGLYIGNTAKVSNKAVLNFFQSNPTAPVGCIIPMDYPNRVSGLVNAIINNNLIRNMAVLRSSQMDGFWGDFGKLVFCPKNQFVFGYRLRSEAKQGGDDDTALNDIELRCARKGNDGRYTTIYSSYMPWGKFKGYKYCSGSDNPVIGFDMKIESRQGNGDDTAANKVDLYCKKGGYISAETATSWGSWTSKQLCPSGQAVIGISTRVERKQGNDDDTALNGVRMYCKVY